MTTTTPPDNLRICINELYKIVAELPAGDNAARLNSVIAMLQAETDERADLVEALGRISKLDKHGGYNTACDIARAILAKIGAS